MIKQETAKSMLAALKVLQERNWKAGEGCPDPECYVCQRNQAAISIAERAIKDAEQELGSGRKI